MRLYDLETPEQIQILSIEQLEEVANDIREFLIDSLSKTGGQLARNLSVVDLTIAMHYVFHAPEDKIIFDIGDQGLTHKILTGRSNRFALLSKMDGLNSFNDSHESSFDTWKATPPGDGLSIALGMAAARDFMNHTNQVLCLFDYESLYKGSALEALGQIAKEKRNLILIYNDDSLEKEKKGRFNFSKSPKKINRKYHINSNKPTTTIHKNVKNKVSSVKGSLHKLSNHKLFNGFGIDSIGPIDGHDMNTLIQTFNAAKNHKGPIVVHVKTIKGYGSKFIQKDKNWNPLVPFHLENGKALFELPKTEITWDDLTKQIVSELSKENTKIYNLDSKQISYSHRIRYACGLASNGFHPFLSIPSCEVLNCLEAIQSNLCFMDLPIIVNVNQAGLLGETAPIFQGIHDIVHFTQIPNLIYAQAKDAKEYMDLYYTALQSNHPFFIRSESGHTKKMKENESNLIQIGSWSQFQIGMNPQSIVITYGNTVDRLINKAKQNNLELLIVNARFFKPIDTKMLKELLLLELPIYVCETDRKGGLSAIIQSFANQMVYSMGIEDHFVEQGSMRSLRIRENITIESFLEEITRDYDAIR